MESDVVGPLAVQPLPVALGQLKPIVEWWLTSTDAIQPGDAPPATAGESLTLISSDAPELLPISGALCALLTNRDAAQVTSTTYDEFGRIDHDAWMIECALVRDHLAHLRPLRSNLPELRASVPAEISDLSDRMCAPGGGPIIVDGPIAAASLLLAYESDPECLERIRPLQSGQSQTESLTWEYLRIDPILPISTGYSDGELLDVGIALINRALTLATRR